MDEDIHDDQVDYIRMIKIFKTQLSFGTDFKSENESQDQRSMTSI
jgi:hypothetical protein